VFGIVRDFEDVGPFVYNRLNQMATGASTWSIGSGSAQSYGSFVDSNNKDLFYEEDTGHMLHAFIGIAPPDLRMFVRYPAGIPRGNLSKIKQTTLNAEAKGYQDGNDGGSPFDLPTSRLELMLPKEIEVEFGLYNPLPYTITPQFNIVMRRYRVSYYNPEVKEDRVTIQNIIDGVTRARWWSPHVQKFDYDALDKLGISAIEIKWR